MTDKMAQKISEQEIQTRLTKLIDWKLEKNELTKTLSLKNFVEALLISSAIGQIAENQGHHPDLEVGYGRVKIRTTTHDEGGITLKDFRLASEIDRMLSILHNES